MIRYFLYCLLLISICLGCSSQYPNGLSPEAGKYIDEVVVLLQNHSLHKNNINWQAFKQDVYLHASHSKTTAETYPSVFYAIGKLNDHHSYFAPNLAPAEQDEEKPLPVLQDEIVPADVGYIRIPFCMGNAEQTAQYISTVREKMMRQDKPGLKGWIVDLRGNFGGNMWPMLVALGPVLGQGTAGYFIDRDEHAAAWVYKNGKAYLNDEVVQISDRVDELKTPNPFVAVLTDTATASSGEAMAVAFKGRGKTRSFGKKTYGVSTGNQSYTLSDGSRINLTESVFADRSKNKYGHSIAPDVECADGMELNEALRWINTCDVAEK